MARKKIIAGNWKMNMTPSEAVALVNELKPLVVNDEVDVVSRQWKQQREPTSRSVLRTCILRKRVLIQARFPLIC